MALIAAGPRGCSQLVGYSRADGASPTELIQPQKAGSFELRFPHGYVQYDLGTSALAAHLLNPDECEPFFRCPSAQIGAGPGLIEFEPRFVACSI
jgi:hypothetical protein